MAARDQCILVLSSLSDTSDAEYGYPGAAGCNSAYSCSIIGTGRGLHCSISAWQVPKVRTRHQLTGELRTRFNFLAIPRIGTNAPFDPYLTLPYSICMSYQLLPAFLLRLLTGRWKCSKFPGAVRQLSLAAVPRSRQSL